MYRLLNSDDVKKIAGDVDIITYDRLANIDSLSNLKKDLVILYRHNPSVGHWVGLIKHGPHLIEYFDSYGHPVDDPMKWVPSYKSKNFDRKYKGVLLGQDLPLLSMLILKFLEKDKRNKVVYNEHKYQDRKLSNSSTCGRYVGHRIRYKNIPLERYQNLFDNTIPSYGAGRINYGEDPDEYIVRSTEIYLD